MNQPEAQTLLEPDDVLGPYGIGLPQSLVEVLPIPAAEFGSAMIDVVEGTQSIEDPLDLAELTDVCTRIQ